VSAYHHTPILLTIIHRNSDIERSDLHLRVLEPVDWAWPLCPYNGLGDKTVDVRCPTVRLGKMYVTAVQVAVVTVSVPPAAMAQFRTRRALVGLIPSVVVLIRSAEVHSFVVSQRVTYTQTARVLTAFSNCTNY